MVFSLEEFYNNQKEREKKRLLRLEQPQPGDEPNWTAILDAFWNYNQTFAIANLFLEKDLQQAKQHFYLCGRLDEVDIKKYNSRVFDYGVPRVCYALCSDNLEFLRRFADLRYKGDGKNYPDMDVMVEEGESAIYCHSILMIIKEDWDGLSRNLNILENVTLPKAKGTTMRLDYEFYKAVLERNTARITEIIEELVSPEIHKKRNDEPIFGKYVSMPALGYAKLAWQKGLEVEVNSPLVPKELLPVRPLERYEDSYGFL